MRLSLKNAIFTLLIVISICPMIRADDGYDLWMSCKKLDDEAILEEYRQAFSSIVIEGDSETLGIVREEVKKGLGGLLGVDVPVRSMLSKSAALVIGTPAISQVIQELNLSNELTPLGREGFLIRSVSEGFLIRSVKVKGIPSIIITANEDVGLLYGSFHLCQGQRHSINNHHGKRGCWPFIWFFSFIETYAKRAIP